MEHRHGTREWLGLLTLSVLWGSAFMLTKVAVTGLPPDLVVAGRLAVGAAILVTLALTLGPARRRRAGHPPWGPRLWVFLVLIGFFSNALPFTLVTWGLRSIDSALAGILMAIVPLATLGLAHYFVPGESMTRFRAAGFLLGFAGVAVLMGPRALAGLLRGETAPWPMLAVLAGALCYAVASILARLRPPSEALPSAAVTTSSAAAMLLPLLLAPGALPPGPPPGWAPVLAVLALGTFSTGLAAVVYLDLVKRAGAAFVSQLNYLIPVWAVLLGMVFLDEQLTARQVAALALILGGILMTHLEPRRGPDQPPPADAKRSRKAWVKDR